MRTFRDRATSHINRGAGVAGTVALHAAAILSFVLAGRQVARVSALPAYRVELVAAPRETGTPAEGGQPAAAPAPVPPPPPAPAARPAAHSAPAPKPRPAVTHQPPAATHQPPAPAHQPAAVSPSAAPGPPAPSPNTQNASSNGTDAATIRTEGVEFPFPGYLRNLVAQVYRRWRPPAGNVDLEAEMLFFVHRDGTISGLQFVKRSGSFAFDLEAQGAVESAARAGAFGTLPAGFGPETLPVSFFFSPRSLR